MAGGMCGGGPCVVGGMHSRGMHGRGACMAEGVHGRGHAWQGVCMAGGHAWQGACVAGWACMAGGMRGRYYEIRSMSRWYASYWNAFLLIMSSGCFQNISWPKRSLGCLELQAGILIKNITFVLIPLCCNISLGSPFMFKTDQKISVHDS